MNKYKRLLLFLCSALVCCVGFLSTDKLTVYAYENTYNFYPIESYVPGLYFYDEDFNLIWSGHSVFEGGKHHYDNPELSNVYAMIFQLDNGNDENFTFPYNPDVYDYYVMGTLCAVDTTDYKSTWKPRNMQVSYHNYTSNTTGYNNNLSVNFYDIDTGAYAGFGFYTKVDFEGSNNIGIKQISFFDDKDGVGNKPANLKLEIGIMAIEKSGSMEQTQAQILRQLQQMEQSMKNYITDSTQSIVGNITQGFNDLQNKIEEQFGMSDDEDFDVGSIQGQVEQKLGVLNFTADTLGSFLDLFNANTVGDTKITFPSYSIEIQGETYLVWDNIEFDFSFLEENFGILITAVRTVTVLCVWLAVLSYLGKAKDQIIINRG